MSTDTLTNTKDRRIIRNAFYIQMVVYMLASFPIAFAELFDGIIIGRYLGEDSIAAFGIVSPLVTAFTIVGVVISAGVRKRYIRFIGLGQKKEAQQVFSLSCVLAVGIALVIMIFVIAFATPITRWLGAKGNAAELLPAARSYLLGVVLGTPARNLMWVLWILMPIDSDRSLPIIATIILMTANILLDLLVAVTLHGHTFGMGLVTSICYTLATAVLLLHFRRKNVVLHFSLRELPWRECGNVFQLGSYSGISKVSTLLRGSYMNNMLAAIAAAGAIAAFNVHRQAGVFIGPLMIAMADTVSVMVGLLNAERDRPMIKKLLSTSIRATAVFTLGVAVLVFVFARQFALLFISGQSETITMATRAVRCYAVGMPLYGLNAIYYYYLQSTGKKVLASVTGFLLEGGFIIASAAVLSGFIGMDAAWFAFPVAQAVMMIYYRIVIAFQNHKMGIRGAAPLDRVLLLPADFDVSEEDQLDVSITSMDEVMGLSQEVWDFCDRHGCDEKRKYLLSLAVEEMAGNVIKHGFNKDDKAHSLDVRILKDGDSYILRMRDDCRVFDPITRLELFSGEDMTRHIGIRMIANMSREMRHTCVMKLNNLFVKV